VDHFQVLLKAILRPKLLSQTVHWWSFKILCGLGSMF